jgi:uncharacterized membrane protein
LQEILNNFSEMIQSMDTLSKTLMTALISMIPVIELRGALPIAMHAGLPWYLAYPAAVIGNMLPLPFIVMFIRKIFNFLKAKTKLGGIVARLETRAEKKMPSIRKYEFWGLAVFVAIPLPGTGGWTGALIAAMMDMRLKKALPSIFIGVLLAGAVVTLLAYGLGSL